MHPSSASTQIPTHKRCVIFVKLFRKPDCLLAQTRKRNAYFRGIYRGVAACVYLFPFVTKLYREPSPVCRELYIQLPEAEARHRA